MESYFDACLLVSLQGKTMEFSKEVSVEEVFELSKARTISRVRSRS